ncbi:MAG: WD40 repeat domain-containing protein [Planctomycetia bacterium]|nr:WD40 repeat domain-containing protein [Planctomycetia bacterium]
MATLNSQDSRQYARDLKYLLRLVLLISISLACLLDTGCCQTLFPNRSAHNRSMRLRRQKQLQQIEEVEEAPVEYADLVLQTESNVEQIRIAPDARHILVESSASADPALFASFDSIDHQLVAVELWNIEFADPRRETFAYDRASIATNLQAVAFDKTGKRLFWSDKEVRAGLLAQQSQYTTANDDKYIIRGASYDQLHVGRYYASVPQNNDEDNNDVTFMPVPYHAPLASQHNAPSSLNENDFPDLNELFQPTESEINAPDANGYLEMAAIPSDVTTRLPYIPAQGTSQTLPENAPGIPWGNQTLDDYPTLTQNDVEEQTLDPLATNDELILQEEDANPDASEEQTAQEQEQESAQVEEQEESEQTEETIQVDPRDVMTLQEFESMESLQNVVLTKSLASTASLFMVPRNNAATLDDAVKHIKTAPEMKAANAIWISQGSQWIVCRGNQDADDMIQNLKQLDQKVNRPEENAKSTETQKVEYNPNWALVSLRDRKRVVRFPLNVKMTFDASASDDEISGQIVDILDVSDAGELVATLVEEYPENSLNQSPRYKIVIWDLNTPTNVPLEKAKQPLMAPEVAQIAIAAPITRRFCKFNHDGSIIAARVEPKYVSMWQAANGKLVAELGEHRDVITDFDFAYGESKLAVATSAGVARVVLWEIRKGIVLKTLDDSYDSKNAVAVAFTNDNQYVYFANDLGQIKRWAIKH